ncbi:hypothetical protein [Tautonia sociabilis]|uniref:Toxin-antitoxin system HicB family antitoxin n=1 Tax=Tautonia sociabilis TaxID=2080755 RepID=A0A432MDH0_9BACT|nr:hypothetical protein [Tautonia sociabilis]RUL82528.1 hypothetical protein TsocGM_23325 [Tautonia sociabilis]
MLKPKVQISKQLHERVRVAAATLGVTAEEFVEKTLEEAAEKVIVSQGHSGELSKEEEEAIANQLKGLGYLE